MHPAIWLPFLVGIAVSGAHEHVPHPEGQVGNYYHALRTYRHLGTSITALLTHLLSGTASGTETLQSSAAPSFPNVSQPCLEQIFVVVGQINPSHPPPEWVIRFLDAQAKPPSSIMEGNIAWFGGFHECMNLTTTYQDATTYRKDFMGQYCLVTVGVDEPVMREKSSLFPPIEKALRAGICVPGACSIEDVHNLVDFGLDIVKGKYPEVIVYMPNVSVLDVHCPQREIPRSAGAIIVIVVMVVLAALVFAGTTYDVLTNGVFGQNDGFLVESSLTTTSKYTTLLPPEAVIASEPELEVTNGRGLFGRILLCFSVLLHTKRMFRTHRVMNELPWLHGIRVLSMFWIILGQTYGMGIPLYDNLAIIPDFMKQSFSQIIIQSVFTIDTFLFISGFLTAYHFLNGLATGGFSGFRLVRLYVSRYFRLFPAYMVVLGIYATLTKHITTGPLWPQDEVLLGNCSNLAWTNAFYINNLVQPERMCMPWTWYIAIDFQLFVVAPFVVLALFTFWRIGLALCGAGVLIAVVAAGVISKLKELPPSLMGFGFGNSSGSSDITALTTMDQELTLRFFTSHLITTYTRAAPYFIGIAAAHFLKDPPNVRRVSSLALGAGWALALTGMGLVVFGLLPGFNGYPLSVDAAAAFNSLSHVVWAASLAWIFYSCITSSVKVVEHVLGWSAWIPISTMSYSVFLVSPIVISAYYLSRESTIHFSHYNAWILFLGNLAMCLIAGFVIYILVEAPMRSLTKHILTRRRGRSVVIEDTTTERI
ncbi:hypothetical protein RvY_01312 [Ramazzottius varieornatus]|uniref:Nose resistant-to-fluoxetine protein N-terminal domain-containing protein n=1 Tax=Ramazzottius varieornatus TaxID=947166 RepID=A0A1D1UGR7_RAMVA|nr:hypothetical protein RvY_01312 [Ramazzottius varieornatus]